MSTSQIKSGTSDFQADVTSANELKVTTSSGTSSTKSYTNDGFGNPINSTVTGSQRALLMNQTGFANGTNYRITVGNAASVQLLAGNTSRQYAYIFNGTGNALYIKFNDAAVSSQGILIPNNTMFSINFYNLWLGSINGISAIVTGTVVVDVFEGTY